MQALILAAGRGSRLGSLSEGLHKCLLEVGRRPLFEHQLRALAEAGIGPVAMVVGYCADEVRERVGVRADFISNPVWATTNSMYSFSLAREWIKGDVVILNCDTVFHPEILERLAETPGDAIAYDSNSGQGREHMKVNVLDGSLSDMSKELLPEMVSGENVGILKLTHETVLALLDKADELINAGQKDKWLGSAVKEVSKERKLGCVDIAPLPWAEIDFAEDLNRARKEVWPAIEKSRWKAKVRWRQTRWAAGIIAFMLIATITASGWLTRGRTWEVLDITAPGVVEQVLLKSGEAAKTMWVYSKGETASFEVFGDRQLKISSRLVLDDAVLSNGSNNYVIEVRIDGNIEDWYKLSSKPSKKWLFGDSQVGKSSNINLQIPDGSHTVDVEFVGGNGKVLLRVKQEDISGSD